MGPVKVWTRLTPWMQDLGTTNALIQTTLLVDPLLVDWNRPDSDSNPASHRLVFLLSFENSGIRWRQIRNEDVQPKSKHLGFFRYLYRTVRRHLDPAKLRLSKLTYWSNNLTAITCILVWLSRVGSCGLEIIPLVSPLSWISCIPLVSPVLNFVFMRSMLRSYPIPQVIESWGAEGIHARISV